MDPGCGDPRADPRSPHRPPVAPRARGRRPTGANCSPAYPPPRQQRPDKSGRTLAMTTAAESPESDATLEEDVPYVGLLTRLLSWAVDFLLIDLAAIIAGLGV